MRLFVCLSLLALSSFSTSSAVRQIHTIAGTGTAGYSGDGGPSDRAQVANPYGLARGPDGALYVCEVDNHVVRRIGKDGVISTVVGTGRRGYGGDGGPARMATMNEPYEIRFDSHGNMLVVEMRNHLVRHIDMANGRISTLAGTGQAGFAGDGGPAAKGQFNQPHSLQLDSAGNIYICDIGNNRIRRVSAQGRILTTFAGTGDRGPTPDGAPFSTVPLRGPRALDFAPDGTLWLALREGNAIYKLDLKKGTLQHAAGTGAQGFSGNGGPAKVAKLSGPKGLSLGPDGHVYFADTESHSLRMLDVKKGTVELVAGTGERGDGPEPNPLQCRMARPHGIFVDIDGSIYVGDSEAHRVRVIR